VDEEASVEFQRKLSFAGLVDGGFEYAGRGRHDQRAGRSAPMP
jgi:hypothetical protein